MKNQTETSEKKSCCGGCCGGSGCCKSLADCLRKIADWLKSCCAKKS